jgi:hypothetical protein
MCDATFSLVTLVPPSHLPCAKNYLTSSGSCTLFKVPQYLTHHILFHCLTVIFWCVVISKVCRCKYSHHHAFWFLHVHHYPHYTLFFTVMHPTFVPRHNSTCDQVCLDMGNVTKTWPIFVVQTQERDPMAILTNPIFYNSFQETRHDKRLSCVGIACAGSTRIVGPTKEHGRSLGGGQHLTDGDCDGGLAEP